MEIGFAVPGIGSWATPAHQREIAVAAERLGYTSVWTLQRLVNPAGGGDSYRRVGDPIVTLAHLAGVTSRIRLGLAVVNLPFFSPVLLAKQLATLDLVSDGRLDAGLGLGWMPEEFAASGVPEERRGARAEEFLTVLRALWTEDVVEFSGDFYAFPPIICEPKPVQRPHPPILLGGFVPAALRRAGRRADGWISSSRADPRTLGESIETIRQAAREAGRDPGSLRFVCRGVVRVGPAGAPDRVPLTGSYEEIRGDLELLRRQGMTEVFYDLNFDPAVGSLAADPAESMRRARTALEELAPGRLG